MSSLNIDFRDGCLRILVIKDGSVKYSKLVKDFSLTDLKSAKEKLASEIKEASWKKGKANVILPSDIVRHKTFQIPAMEFEDAKIFIRREISKELKGQKFAYGIRRLLTPKKAKPGGQNILTEYVLTADVVNYLDLLKSCGISPDIMTSSLEGNIHLFNRFRPETDGNEVIIDIGMNLIEIAVFNNRRLLGYEKLSIPSVHDEKLESKDFPADQTDKIKIYRIIDTLYKFIMASGETSPAPEEKLSVLWICGLGSTLGGITDSISDGLGIDCRVINPFDTEVENASALTALKGVSTISRTEPFINLIPEDILAARAKLLRRALLAASLSFYIILLIGGYTILNRTEEDLKIAYEKVKSDQAIRSSKHKTDDIYSTGQDTFAKIVSNSRGMYGIFKDIANLTPSGVILNDIKIEKAEGVANLKLDATIKYSDENFKNAVLSKFLQSLDSSPRLKRVSNPEITVSKSADGQRDISVKTAYEIVQ
jgi:Tfp pilus assembly PilM family ATPase